MKKNKFFTASFLFYLLVSAISLFAAERFPRPEFDNNHQIPSPSVPAPPPDFLHIIDLSVLILAIAFASYFAVKARSRKGIAVTLAFSLLYFGFYKGGCVCPVGSLQNVTLALFNSSYLISWVTVAVFAVPLLFTLFFGRTFCSSVCPLGAIQDIFILKPLKVPAWLEDILGLIPYFYLGLALLFAATGSGFLICRYDPFVGFFRFSAPFFMTVGGALVLILSLFIARPYCRYLCPYSVFLRWASFLSWRHMTISPDKCVKCRLCEDACPFGAIKPPAPQEIRESRSKGVGRLFRYLIAAPVIILLFAFAGRLTAPTLAGYNPVVMMAEGVVAEASPRESKEGMSEIYAPLFAKADSIRENFVLGGTLLGLFIGIVIASKLIALSFYPAGDRYRPDKMKCLSCGRCMRYCPVEKTEL